MTRHIRRAKRATIEQCIRLIQMAGVTFGMSMQLKSCSGDVFFNDNPVTGGIVDRGNEWQLVWWTLSTSCMCYFVFFALLVFFLHGAVHGFAAMVIGGGLLLSGPLAWNHYTWLRSVAIRHSAVMMGFRFRWTMTPETVYQALGEYLTEDMSSWSCKSIGG